ncbi:MAG: hypothetical protein LUC43_04015 [Burkholderiales bacterium]|nr:hypothetical protein [Burkholderiales bacterium]
MASNDKLTSGAGTHAHFVDGLVWNADLTLSDFNEASRLRRQAIEAARANRPKTALLEREIMIAVTGLYVLILGGFAVFHLYGAAYLDEKNAAQEAETAAAIVQSAEQKAAVEIEEQKTAEEHK